ncbi:MAG: acyltransferase family protein [Clostridia bacterium]|nr:acyltransferase family protein [Clostridia bacterium]
MEKINNSQNIAKGILICSVIFFHSMIFLDYSSLNTFNVLFLLFPCVIGVFFFYSGYNYKSQKRTPKESIKKRTKQLLLPLLIIWVLTTILVVPMLRLTNSATLDSIKQSYMYVALSEPWAMLNGMNISTCNFDLVLCIQSGWFLYTLWVVSCIFYLIVDFVNEKLSRHIITVALLLFLSFLMGKFIGTYLPFVVNCYPVVLAIMLTAAYLKKSNYLDKEESTSKICKKVIVFELIIFLISFICYLTFGTNVVGSLMGGKFNDIITGLDAYIAYIFAILGTYIIHSISKLVSKIPVISSLFEKFGENSAFVYITHGITISYIDTLIFHRNHNLFSSTVQSTIYLLIAIVIYTILFRIFKRGKKKNEQRN